MAPLNALVFRALEESDRPRLPVTEKATGLNPVRPASLGTSDLLPVVERFRPGTLLSGPCTRWVRQAPYPLKLLDKV